MTVCFTQKFKTTTKNVAVDPAYTLWVENFVLITVSHTVSEMNAILRFIHTFQMVAKNGRNMIYNKRVKDAPKGGLHRQQ